MEGPSHSYGGADGLSFGVGVDEIRWRRTGDAGPLVALSLSIFRNAHGSSVAVGRIEEFDHRLCCFNRIVDLHYRGMEQVHLPILIDMRLEKNDGYGRT
jgi:hypothetical protein